GGRPEQLTRGPFHKFVNAWSPDGREIIYHSLLADGQRDLFVVSADGAHVEQVTHSPREDEHARWRPDGNAIGYDSPPRGGRSEAFIVRRARRGAAWGQPSQLTRHGSTDPKWSPDGALIAFCTEGELRVIAPDGTGERTLIDARQSKLQEPEYPMWSSD